MQSVPNFRCGKQYILPVHKGGDISNLKNYRDRTGFKKLFPTKRITTKSLRETQGYRRKNRKEKGFTPRETIPNK